MTSTSAEHGRGEAGLTLGEHADQQDRQRHAARRGRGSRSAIDAERAAAVAAAERRAARRGRRREDARWASQATAATA